ncbi:uncharacterized protein [Linepithema humile]|uniref:uncharacterized protein isoform X2 n=1 Tax=Linepithema humile TaxID=83485 RepID=UPI00351DCFD4
MIDKINNLDNPVICWIYAKNYKSEVNTKNRHSLHTIAMKLVYFVLSFVALALAELKIRDFTQNEDRSIDLNKLMDRFNPQISEFIINRGLDPLDLPRTEQKLWVQFPNSTSEREGEIPIQPMIYKADLILHSGKLERLSTLKRYGDATLTYKDNILNTEFGFEFELLEGTYNYILKLVFFDWTGRVTVSGENVHAKVNILFDTTNYILTLNKFELQVDGIKVTFHQNGLAGAIKTAIVNMIIPFFKNTITDTVQKEVTNTIQFYFNEINRIIAPREKSEPVFNYQLLNQLLDQLNK